METVYKREKKYNDEAGGRLSGDMDDTRENGDKVQELVSVENLYNCCASFDCIVIEWKAHIGHRLII